MLVADFMGTCAQYENFAVWDVENIDAFLNGNGALIQIFEKDFKMKVAELAARRSEIDRTDMQIMEQLLDQIGDKHFFIFTYHDDKHWQLVQMQKQKIMQFGLDIEDIRKDHVYILLMDKKAAYAQVGMWAEQAILYTDKRTDDISKEHEQHCSKIRQIKIPLQFDVDDGVEIGTDGAVGIQPERAELQAGESDTKL